MQKYIILHNKYLPKDCLTKIVVHKWGGASPLILCSTFSHPSFCGSCPLFNVWKKYAIFRIVSIIFCIFAPQNVWGGETASVAKWSTGICVQGSNSYAATVSQCWCIIFLRRSLVFLLKWREHGKLYAYAICSISFVAHIPHNSIFLFLFESSNLLIF